MKRLDRIDRKILMALQTDGRLTNQALADLVGLSPSPCLKRVRALEAARLIRTYFAEIDRKACGLSVTAFVRIRLKDHSPDTVATFERKIAAIDAVIECHLMSGGEDYLLEVVVSGHDGYERFMREELHPVPGIGAIETNFSISAIKHRSPCPIP
ncbi:Lrp/AsnC family transcriptional regulator [Hyphobacterium sp. CCMP332]|jgi:Lrp/AsnC family transcriptional regulator, leucine-responsive regulatory protein|uniref:Lrp/AsnC family transcriptional regulator n=1 Tax=Hyphobacterium sp. CCMP332 TaxID=2749086 RepID=UPI001F270EBD|nr:Lrp/AsnC family transcriptional regulator [Hyphobacterium sp. CCMP332]